jgi:hypothetical protein
MLVPDLVRKSVAFIYYRRAGEVVPAGTGFFVVWPEGDLRTSPRVPFVMTAHHVIAGITAYSDDGGVLLRLNTKDGGSAWAESSVDDWWHPDPHVDCAAMPWNPPPEMNLDRKMWVLDVPGHARGFEEQNIGIGDEVFMVGLFRNHLGRDRNEPIVRVGNIAAIPDDPIMTKDYGEMRAVLVEARSIGGLSGSPVFVHLGYSRWKDGELLKN